MLNLFENPLLFIIWAVSLLVAITVHEFAHAWAADKLGDPTPRLQGRLTLNPLAHLDPIGTIMLLFFRFGWGKPVQFDPYNLKDPRRDAAIISFAGPLSNLALAGILSIIIRLFPLYSLLYLLFTPVITLNIILAIFNLIPIHPLDGGKILVGLLPPGNAREIDLFLQKYGMLILIILIFPWFGTSLIFPIISGPINFILSFLLPGLGAI